MHVIHVSDIAAGSNSRNSVGGTPFLRAGEATPKCALCDATMVLFLQLDIRPEFHLPFLSDSHLLVFMCPTHNEPPSIPDQFDDSPLPPEFWTADEGHYSLLLLPPGKAVQAAAPDAHIAPFQLTFTSALEKVEKFDNIDVGSHEFKVGGVPGWINFAINKDCSCGGKLAFLCQIPDGHGFQQTSSAPEQPDSFSNTEYCLFLGNQVYILGCDRQCDPRALIAVCDN